MSTHRLGDKKQISEIKLARTYCLLDTLANTHHTFSTVTLGHGGGATLGGEQPFLKESGDYQKMN